ncbi:hypothetical protein ACGFWI_00980 [Streptomyces sp. NPDC048434]|uniref:hypothetical protein n=1 Tax=Streptomyces sp. NPDC048434 TaxID=3365549 RepID=UPI00371C1859
MNPTDHDRRQALAAAIRRQGGEWTKRRVLRLWNAAGYPIPRSTHTARRDLSVLQRRGLLLCHETPGRRFYTCKDDAR